MSYALKVARAKKGKVCMICKTSLDEANTSFAQGGVASVTNLEVDNFDKHIQDTMIAGDYISDYKAVKQVVTKAPEQIKELVEWGVNFDQATQGEDYELAREGGHTKRRILHAKDATGLEITSKLLEAGIHVEESDISVFENFGAGYAIPSSSGVAAMRMMASKEGIIIDPVYTGKTFAGLIKLNQQGYFDGRDNILFLHSGGAGGLFAIDIDHTED